MKKLKDDLKSVFDTTKVGFVLITFSNELPVHHDYDCIAVL